MALLNFLKEDTTKFDKEMDSIQEQVINDNLSISFSGYHQMIASENYPPGPKFPFIIGQTKGDAYRLIENVLEGIIYSPSFISNGEYMFSSKSKVFGKITTATVEFELTESLDDLKGFPHDFAKKVRDIMGPEVEKAREKNRSRNLYAGIFQEDDSYKGNLAYHYYNKHEICKAGIFTLKTGKWRI